MKFFLWIVLFSFSCSVFQNKTSYRSLEDEEGNPEWGPREIQETVQTMVVSMESFFKSKNKKPYLEIGKIKNKTSEHIEVSMITDELMLDLSKKNIVFIDRSQREDSLKELALSQKGVIDERSGIEAGKLLSPNFKLIGEINDNVRYDDGEKLQYLIVNLKLIGFETGAVEWQESKKFYKVTKMKSFGM
ncbi:MAG: hypothetical protein H7A24_09770 [Leptospiraceae bacterium]|nr:hypothetical protein [Leptospiraceae bacterium]MCP5512159.1 hypothetical protein [Leptospiraceae bacterium]